MPRLDSRVALVTGGASGLGKAIALRLAAEGACVVITDIQTDIGQLTATQCGFTFLEQDVCEESQWAVVVQEIEARFNRLNILVNNAGILGSMDAVNPENTRFADWKKVFAVNVDSVFLGCRAAIPAMRRAGGGSIINMSSIAGLLATPYATAYGAGKATVRQLTKSVAQHCAQERLNIRCNSVHPGNVMDPHAEGRASMWQKLTEETARRQGIPIEDLIAYAEAATPMGVLVLPEDVAAAVAFLASDDARYITGEKLIVDCGTVNCDTYRMNSKDMSTERRRSFVNRSEAP